MYTDTADTKQLKSQKSSKLIWTKHLTYICKKHIQGYMGGKYSKHALNAQANNATLQHASKIA